MASCNANTLLQTAATNGYYGLDDRGLKICALQLICQGGGGGFAVGTGAPTGATSVSPPRYVDRSTGIEYLHYDGVWH